MGWGLLQGFGSTDSECEDYSTDVSPGYGDESVRNPSNCCFVLNSGRAAFVWENNANVLASARNQHIMQEEFLLHQDDGQR